MSFIFMPNFMQPHKQSIDMGINQIFSCKVNGDKIDSYKLVIKKLDNTIAYDSSKKVLTTPLFGTQTLEIPMAVGSVTYRGQLKWILTYFNGEESVSSGEMIFTNMTTPTITEDIPSIVKSRKYMLSCVYAQLEKIPIKRWNIELFDSKDNLLQSSGDTYSSLFNYELDGFANNTNYYVVMTVETQSLTGSGIIVKLIKAFKVQYSPLTLAFQPNVTQLEDKSAMQVDWSLLSQDAGAITGNSSYVNGYLKEDNVGFLLENGSNLKYDDFTIPEKFTMSFMKQISKDFNGILFTTKNGDYKVGYSNIQATVESDIIYAGTWVSEGSSNYHNDSTKYSNVAKNNISLSYSGTGVRMYFVQSEKMGIAEIFIDGISIGNIDLYKALIDNSVSTKRLISSSNLTMVLEEHNESKTWNDLATKTWNDLSTLNIEDLVFKYVVADISDYIYDAHNIKVNVTGTKNTSSRDTQINFKSIEVLNGFCDNKFYSIIQGKIKYGEKIKITDNPFIFTLLPNGIKMKQYNFYNDLYNIKNYSWNDLKDFSIDFLTQSNN